MNIKDIRRHLDSYSIVQRRKTTINHAFASALAPCDAYDEERVRQAMELLGQIDPENLVCVYCNSTAETWDHLVGLVKKSELAGYGHQLGNLVPCCRACNSLKGGRDWRAFVRMKKPNEDDRRRLEAILEEYIRTFAADVDVSHAKQTHPEQWRRYADIKGQIIDLMAEADRVASGLRPHVIRRDKPTGD